MNRSFIYSVFGSLALSWAAAFLSPALLHAEDGYRFDPPKGWSMAEDTSTMKTWKGDSAKKQLISVAEDSDMKLIKEPPSDSRLIELFKQGAEIPNELAKITGYEIEKVEREKLPKDVWKIVVFGHFTDAAGTQIRFEEWKYFSKNGYGMIQYSEASFKSLDRDEVSRILKRYQPFGS